MSANEAKVALRRVALERRGALDGEVRERFAERLAIEGVSIARRAIARTVAAFWPLRDEPDASGLVHALSYHDFVAALPVVSGRGMPLVFRRWTARDRLVEGPFGVMEPSARLPEVFPDIVFVPLAAFDRRGNRVGYGAGFYDITLRALRASKPVLAVGVAYAVQEVAEIPVEPHDEPLDLILTDNELIECRMD